LVLKELTLQAREAPLRIPVATDHPDEPRFQIYLQRVSWTHQSTVVLRSADGKECSANIAAAV